MSALNRLLAQHGNPLRIVIRTDGTIELLKKPEQMARLMARIHADTLDTVILFDRKHVMLVDDAGHARMLPVNREATALYLDRCRPGTTHQIRGDVVVVPDSDFGGPL